MFVFQRSRVKFYHELNYTATWDFIEEEINENPDVDNVTLPYSRDKYDRSGKQGE